MKEVTYEDWIKNPTPREMWVWEDDVKDMVKRKVVYVIKGGPRRYPVRVTTNDDTDYEAYRHCAEIEEPEPKTRRMTHKELSRWLVARTTDRGRRMTVKELKKVIETLPDDFEIVISTDIGGNRPFNFRELEDISVDIGYSSKVVHFFGILEGGELCF